MVLEPGKSKIKVPAWVGSYEGSLPAWLPFTWCMCMERMSNFALFLFYKATDFIGLGPHAYDRI